MRYVLKVAYDGTHFSGWQSQTNGRTVQDELNKAVYTVFKEKAIVTASGRTDAGVHALGQVCHVDLSRYIEGPKLADALNGFLPADVSVLSSAIAPEGFDANRSAKRKTYSYTLRFAARRNPMLDRYAVQIRRKPDIKSLRDAASMFVGEHDFAAYCASGSAVKTTIRKIYSCRVYEENGYVKIDVCGNGFLYNMVRTIVGTILGYAFGKIPKEQIAASLFGSDRELVGKTMPAKGLVLKSVDYGEELFTD